MRISENLTPEFDPITVTIETEDEAKALFAALFVWRFGGEEYRYHSPSQIPKNMQQDRGSIPYSCDWFKTVFQWSCSGKKDSLFDVLQRRLRIKDSDFQS